METEYQKALEIVTQQPVLAADLDRNVLQGLCAEFHAGDFYLGRPADEDTAAFLFAVLGLKILAGCECDFDRAASARLLRASADAIEHYEFVPAENPEDVQVLDRITILNGEQESTILLVRYSPPCYPLPARAQILGSIQWSHVT